MTNDECGMMNARRAAPQRRECRRDEVAEVFFCNGLISWAGRGLGASECMMVMAGGVLEMKCLKG